ncbi:unnamed protein product [Brassica oleracea var. botrytis]
MSHRCGSPIQPGSIGSVTYCSSTTVNESHWREIELSNHEGIHSQIKFLDDIQKQSQFLVYLYVHDTMEDVYVCAYITLVCMIFGDVFDFFR